MNFRPEVLVIGGGVIGAAVADALARAGTEVVLIDKGRPGYGCSYGNAGWVAPCFATPLPRPGLLLKAARWMTDPTSPLRIPFRADPALLSWLVRFLWNARQTRFVSGTRALVELSEYSLEAFRELAREHPGGLDMKDQGLLQLGLTSKGVEQTATDLRLMEDFGVQGTVLDEQAVRELEPAITGRVHGGVHFVDEGHLEPLEAVRALLARAERAGARVIPDTEAIRLRYRGTKVCGVETTRGWLEPDEVVLAAGTWSRELARQVGVGVPVFGGKGYSMTLERSASELNTPIMVVERKVAITPHGSRIRFAGTLELVRDDRSISLRRVAAIRRTGTELLGVPDSYEVGEIWRGLRPCTPDGLPLIGRSSEVKNLILATGHQMLGLQTAPATGRLVADLVQDRSPTFNPAPFSPARFE